MRGKIIFRGLTRRCPRCGEWRIFNGWFRIKDECPRCGLDLKREEGYYVGAMTVNIAVAEILTVLLLVIGIIVTWPELPLLPLIAIGVGVNILFPIVFYPLSKTIWLAIDLGFFHQMSRDEIR